MAKPQISVRVSPHCQRRVRAALERLRGEPVYGRRPLSLDAMVEYALLREVAFLEAQFNGGKAFPAARRPTARGRPKARR
jgi:hypothetical protein